jgi:membrane-bound serine protease (ClpP class)
VGLDAMRVVERALHVAAEGPGSALVLEIQSPGGRFDAAQLIVADIDAADVPVYVLVTDNAWGAAALVALAGDSVFMRPDASIGAGMSQENGLRDLPLPARRALRAKFGALVRRRGIDPRLGEGMVDDQIVIPEIVTEGGLVTLSTEDAVRTGIAAAAVQDLGELLSQLGLPEIEVVTVGPQWTGTVVEVTNRNWRDVAIYILRSSARFRLGTVTSMNSQQFEIPGGLLVPGAVVRVLAEAIGSSERVTTEDIRVEHGLVIQWVIEHAISQSNYFYYVRE